MRLEYKRKSLPAVYAAIGSMSGIADDSGENYFAEYGIILGGDYLNFIFPLYVTDPSPHEKHIEYRFQLKFRIPINISY